VQLIVPLESFDHLVHLNTDQTFTIDCNGDICVGDTILLTERLFSRPQDASDSNLFLNSNGSKEKATPTKIAWGSKGNVIPTGTQSSSQGSDHELLYLI
jgi:hypothetical protein